MVLPCQTGFDRRNAAFYGSFALAVGAIGALIAGFPYEGVSTAVLVVAFSGMLAVAFVDDILPLAVEQVTNVTQFYLGLYVTLWVGSVAFVSVGWLISEPRWSLMGFALFLTAVAVALDHKARYAEDDADAEVTADA